LAAFFKTVLFSSHHQSRLFFLLSASFGLVQLSFARLRLCIPLFHINTDMGVPTAVHALQRNQTNIQHINIREITSSPTFVTLNDITHLQAVPNPDIIVEALFKVIYFYIIKTMLK
jgi:hypothetical protein